MLVGAILLFGLAALPLLLTQVEAAAGALDSTFGTGGKVVTHLSNGDDRASAVAVQSDGKIVAAGYANGVDFAVVRYNTNGSLDTSFNGTGIVVTDIAGHEDFGRAIAIQSDGKIVVAGESNNGTDSDFAVVRYNPNGSLDTTFDGDGKVTTAIGSFNDEARAMAIQSDGKIIVAGDSNISGLDFSLVRYNTDGSLDTSFDGDGKLTTDLGSTADIPYAVAVQSDGRVVVAGRSAVQFMGTGFALARYNTNGSLDTSFDGDGKLITLISNNFDVAQALAIQSDGKIVAGGFSNSSPLSFTLVRYNTNGSLDTGFGGGGKVITPFGSDDSSIQALTILGNGKIVAAGSALFSVDFAVARYNSNGTLDTGFGAGGKVTTAFGPSTDIAMGVAIQSNGNIVAAGYSRLGTNDYDIALARYQAGVLYAASRRFDFDGDGKSDLSVYRPSSGIWYILNSSTNTLSAQQFGGLPQDKLVPADYNGDGRTEVAYFRSGIWRITNATGDIQFGLEGDVPVPADYDGDSKADIAVFRQGAWYIQQSTAGTTGFTFGISTDKPVPADYDGDGKFDPAVYRDGAWYLLRSTDGFTGVQFGISTDRPVPADYDGDGKADVAVYRDGIWYVLGSSAGFSATQFGLSTDVPVPADYDGDGKADVAVYRDGAWYILNSSDGSIASQLFGTTGDAAIPAAYLP